MPSFATPTRQQIDAAVQRMTAPEFAAYFLSRLNNPRWVAALDEAGMFDSPPPPIVASDGTTRFPHWPASNYLVRMAPHVPAEVATILARLKTDNALVIGDIIEAARAMPASHAARLVSAVVEAVRSRGLWMQFQEASDLCARLAKGGQLRQALDLAAVLFEPSGSSENGFQAWQDRHWYEKGMSTVVPVLAEVAPRQWLATMSNWLQALIDAQRYRETDSDDDSSNWWRPAVEEHAQNSDFDLRSMMTGSVREAFERAVRGGHLELSDALGILQDRSPLIFQRLRLHLVNEFADRVPALARRLIMDRNLFEDYRYKHEYSQLVGRRFSVMSVDERRQWFSWIDSGPDLTDREERLRHEHGKDVGEAEREAGRRYWQFERLHWVRHHLLGDRKVIYDEMHRQYGDPELADFSVHVSTGWGWGGSPFTVGELSELSFAEVIEKVVSWIPPKNQFRGPTLEGLADVFGQYVAENVEELSAQAETLIGQSAMYVQKFLTQMTEGVKSNRDIDALTILQLCDWVVEQPLKQDGRTDSDEERPRHRWQWTRDEVSRFVQALVEARTGSRPRYPLEPYRELIWGVLHTLSRDPAESNILHDTSKDDPRGSDYLTLAINSPRGKALEAALEYSRWVANNIKEEYQDGDLVPGGFAVMPEVREILDRELAAGNRTVQSMAIIGSRFGLIYWLDRDWLAARATQLFDLEGLERVPRAAEGWAAWNAFLVWVRPHVEFYRLFKAQFAYAVAQASGVGAADQSHERPLDHLAEHLMVLYGRGQLGMDDDDGLLRRFLGSAHPDTRRHALEFVGRVLEGENLPQDFVDRYRFLWDEYWAGAGRTDAEGKPDAALFGFWFASGRFEPSWALSRLEGFAEIAPVPEPDHLVIKELARMAAQDTETVLRILDRMMRSDREGWRIRMWLESARTILETAIRAGGEARQTAERLIDYLGRRGYSELGELLEIGQGSG